MSTLPGCRAWEDPGPCPVDDTPHTACTTVAAARRAGAPPGTLVVIPVRPPAGLPVPPVAERVEFTTATYRRDLHGPPGLRRRGRPPKTEGKP